MYPKKYNASPYKYCVETSTWVEQSAESKRMHHQNHHHQRNSLCSMISPVRLELSTSPLATFNSAPSLITEFHKKRPENRLHSSNSSNPSTTPSNNPLASPCSSPSSSCSAVLAQPQTPTNFESNRLKILSYNIWFSPYYFRERSMEIVSILERDQVDIVCLQEVTQRALNVLKEQKYIQQNYLMSVLDSNSWSEYGIIILTRVDAIAAMSFFTLPTSQDRNLLILELTVNNEKFVVATVHLESLNSFTTRKRQLSIISQILGTYNSNATVLLAGDFNFDSEQNFNEGCAPLENDVLVELFSDYSDVWASLHYQNGLPPPSPMPDGKTYDTRSNLMLHNQKPERMRYDRVLLKEIVGHEHKWIPVDCSLVGTDPILTDTEMGYLVYPSDHFGLLVELEYRELNCSPVVDD